MEESSPLFGFLKRPQVRRVIAEELWRSVAWAGFSLFGWAIIISVSDQLAATVWTVLGVPLLTWASLTVAMIGLRLATSRELQVQHREGLHIVTLGGVVFGGFWALFLIFALGHSPLRVLGLYSVIVGAFLLYYSRIILPRFRPSTKS